MGEGLQRVNRQIKFRNTCAKIKKKIGIDVMTLSEKGPDGAYSDDGNLHVRRDNIRAVFRIDTAQTMSASEYNWTASSILTALGMKRSITERVLVGENDDEV